MRHPAKLLVCVGKVALKLFRKIGLLLRQGDEIRDGLERIIDLVRYCRGESADRSKALSGAQGSFQFSLLGDVARDLSGTDDLPACVLHGRDSQRNVHSLTVLAQANGLKMLDAFTGADLG